MSKFKMDLAKMQEENSKYASAANSIAVKEMDRRNIEISKSILEGKGIFNKMKISERKLILGYSGLIAELSTIIHNPFNYEGESGNKLKRYQIRYAAVQAAYDIYWEESAYPEETKNIIDYLIMRGFDSSARLQTIVNSINDSNLSPARIIYKIFAGKEIKSLFEEFRKILHTYVVEYFKKMKENSFTIYNNSEIQKLYGNDGREGLEVDINIFEYINHKYVDYIFDKKIYNQLLKLIDSTIQLVESFKKISLDEVVIEDK